MSRIKEPDYVDTTDETVKEYQSRKFTQKQLRQNRVRTRLRRWMMNEIMLGLKKHHPETYESLENNFRTKITAEAEIEFAMLDAEYGGAGEES